MIKDRHKTKEQLIAELEELRQRTSRLGALEESLQKTQARLELALKGADLGLWDYNLETGEAYVNERRAEMVGYSVDELGPHISSWGKLVHPDDIERVTNAFNAHVEGRTPLYESEHRLRHKSGEYIWVLARAKVVEWDERGYPVRIVGTSLDITYRKQTEEALQSARNELERQVEERTAELRDANEQLRRQISVCRQAEDALRESEARYRFLAEHAQDILWTMDLNMHTTFVSRSIEKVLGFTHEERMRQDAREQLTPESCEIAQQRLLEDLRIEREQGIQPEKFVVIELDYLHKNGSIVCLESVMSFIRDEKGAPIGIHGLSRDITERKRAEEALKQSEERLALALDGANLGIWSWDLTTGKAVWAERTLQLLGYGPSETESDVKSWKKLVHPEDWPKVSENLNLHIQGKLPTFEVEYRILNKYGDWQWVQAQGKAIGFDADGKPIRMTGVIADATDRKKAEESLAKSEELQRTILSTSPVGIGLSVGRNMVWVNDAWKEMFGLGPNDADPLTINARVLYPTQEEFERVGNVLYEGIEAGQVHETDATMIRKDGTTFDVHLAMKAVDTSDPSRGTIAAITDITNRKRAEREHERAVSLLRSTLESTADGILVVDMDGTIVSFNNRFSELWKIPEQVLALREDKAALVFVLSQLKDPQGFITKVEELYSQPGTESFDVLEFKDGRVFERYSRPQTIGEKIVGRVWSFRDVTERKRAEEEGERLRNQLLQAQKMEAIGTLTGGIAHDFNNLLTIINGFAELILLQTKEDDPRRKDLKKILQTGQKGADMVQRLLAFSKSDKVRLEPLDLNRHCRKLNQAGGKHVSQDDRDRDYQGG